MSIKDTASAILKRLEEGTNAIYAQYREKAKAADASYQQKLRDLDTDYRESARALSGKSRAALSERLTRLSDLGLAASGAAQQARISADNALMGALGQLSAQRQKDKSAAEASYQATASSLAAEGEEKAEKYRDTMVKLLLEQENKDRNYQLQQQKLSLQKQSAASKSGAKSGSGSATTTADGLTLDQKPAKMMSTIVQACRKFNKSERYYYVDRQQVQQAVMQILNDKRISKPYRYQLYAQARAMGYIA